jgi:DNA-directed RNA polymerase sigma subunit (sigma70/sigma32)
VQAQTDAESRAHLGTLQRSVSTALKSLSPEERQFLRMRYGLDDGKAKSNR